MRRSNKILALAVSVAALTASGCTETYLANKDTIAPTSGEAIAINRVTMMVDPWPATSAQRNIAFNGAKMQTAMERYRTNQVYPPQGMNTSGAYQPQQNSGSNNSGPVGPALIQPAAPVK